MPNSSAFMHIHRYRHAYIGTELRRYKYTNVHVYIGARMETLKGTRKDTNKVTVQLFGIPYPENVAWKGVCVDSSQPSYVTEITE